MELLLSSWKAIIMNEAGVIKFLRAVGVGQVNRDNLPWVRSACPLASVSHEDGRDDHPSFGIKINPKGESIYHCFACGSGRLVRLLHNLFVSGLPYTAATQVYSECEIFDGRNDPAEEEFSVIENYKRKPVPTDVLNRFLPIQESSYESKRCGEYLSQRGISPEIQEKFWLRVYPSMQAVVFPRMDEEGNTWALRARPRKFKSFFSISPSFLGEESQWGDYSTWFGGQCLSSGDVPLLVESETDVLRLTSLEVKDVVPIACCGAAQKRQLNQLYQDVVILGFDADQSGRRNALQARKVLRGAVLYGLDWSLVGVKDAGELRSLEDFNLVWKQKKMLSF